MCVCVYTLVHVCLEKKKFLFNWYDLELSLLIFYVPTFF